MPRFIVTIREVTEQVYIVDGPSVTAESAEAEALACHTETHGMPDAVVEYTPSHGVTIDADGFACLERDADVEADDGSRL